MRRLFPVVILFTSFLLLLVFQVNASNEQPTINLTIKNMAYICGCKPDKINPAGDEQSVYQGNYCGFEEIFLMDIDFSNLPKDKEIQSAELKLYCSQAIGAGVLTYEPIIEPWDQKVTYNVRPKSNPEHRVTCNTPVSENWYTVDITPIVKAWQSGAIKNCGLLCSSIKDKDSTFSICFPSNKTDFSKFAPKVTVCFK